MTLKEDRYFFEGGIDPLEIAHKYECPVYVYDGGIIERQYRRMVNAFQVPRLKINYACKALTNISILRLFKSLGACLDAVSIQEVQLGLKAGFLPEEISFTPNGVNIDEILQGAELGVKLHIDNISILEQFGQLRPDYPFGIRINPHIMAGGNTKISTGHLDSKFGISVHQMPHVLRLAEALKLRIEGIHMHTGSDILDAEAFLQAAEILLNAAYQFNDLDYVDFGSGFKVPYRPGDIATDIEDLGKRISDRFNEFCTAYGKDLSLVFEPGKFLVSEAGYFLVRVNVVKTTPATVFAGVDSGLNHLIRPMFYNSYHHITNLSNPTGKPRIYTVVGYICETDTFGVNRQLPEIREGDILCFHNAGAYCFAMSSNYNSRYRPAEVLLYGGRDHLIRKRETMDDLVRNQVDLGIFSHQAV